ncbi:MAG: hypothetical protein IJJ01_05000 [Firmicutes bacterium]|nr:hypothetical protein [Bacillota bacterium]
MTSAKSCKNPERTWFAEMLRRCKALPVLIAVAYFLSNILPVLLSYSRLENVILYTYGAITGSNILNMAIGIAGGVVVSCAVFKYLHSTASVIDAHARPLTRTQLFRGSFFAGLVMIVGPVILTGLLYLCLMGAHASGDMVVILKDWGFENYDDIMHTLTAPHIIGWMLDNILVIGFTYCVSCFAAILAGTAVVQALLSLVLIALPTVIYTFFLGYMNTFLYGYDGGVSLLGYLSPYAYLVTRDAYPFAVVPVTLLVYTAISVLLAFAASAIYRRIKLENEENTIVVPFVAELLVILLTAIAVSMAMFIARSFLSIDTTAGAVITIILATIVFFPIFCMIADQSLRIFKSRNAKVFILYAAVMCLVLAFTLFDVTGFEKRVPAASDVKSVTVEDSNLMHTHIRNITDQDTIALITDLHKSIAERGEGTTEETETQIEGQNNTIYGSIGGIEVVYKLNNGKTLKRNYPVILSESYNAYAPFYNCRTVREHECFNEEEPLRVGQYLSLNDAHVDAKGENINDKTYLVPERDVKGLIKTANKDIRNWTADSRKIFVYEEYDPAKDKSAYGLSVCVDYRLPDAKTAELEQYTSYYNFTTEDKNIVKYIEEHPGLLSNKNVISDDNPIMGAAEEDW